MLFYVYIKYFLYVIMAIKPCVHRIFTQGYYNCHAKVGGYIPISGICITWSDLPTTGTIVTKCVWLYYLFVHSKNNVVGEGECLLVTEIYLHYTHFE